VPRLVLVRHESATFALAVELYLRHRVGSDGRCVRCRTVRCPVRDHAAFVIRAATVDPARLRPPPRRPEAGRWMTEPTSRLPVHRGSAR
jgi:hypothetical protein